MNYRKKSIPYLCLASWVYKKDAKDNEAIWREGLNFKQCYHKTPVHSVFKNRKETVDAYGQKAFEFTGLNFGFHEGRESVYFIYNPNIMHPLSR